MTTQADIEQIENGELPDDLDYEGTFLVFPDQAAAELGIAPNTWTEALAWAGLENVLLEPGYDYHLGGLGNWEQDVGIDFTAGLSPTRSILVHAAMYKARITRKETVTFRDQPLCQAFIAWEPASPRTKDLLTRLLQDRQ